MRRRAVGSAVMAVLFGACLLAEPGVLPSTPPTASTTVPFTGAPPEPPPLSEPANDEASNLLALGSSDVIAVADSTQVVLLNAEGEMIWTLDAWRLSEPPGANPMLTYGFSLEPREPGTGSAVGLYSKGLGRADGRFPLAFDQTPGCVEHDTRVATRIYWCTGILDELRIRQANTSSDEPLGITSDFGSGTWLGARLSREAAWVVAARWRDSARVDYLIELGEAPTIRALAEVLNLPSAECVTAVGWLPDDRLLVQRGGQSICSRLDTVALLALDPNTGFEVLLYEQSVSGETRVATYFQADISG